MTTKGEAMNLTVEGKGYGNWPIVIACGFGHTQDIWSRIVPGLTDPEPPKHGYRVLLYDHIGSRATDPELYNEVYRCYLLNAHADDLVALLKEQNVSTCIFVGHCVYAMVAMLASTKHPHLFKKIIMVSAYPPRGDDDNHSGAFEQNELDQLDRALREYDAAGRSRRVPQPVETYIHSLGMLEFSRSLFTMRRDIALSIFFLIRGSDLRPMLPQVVVPCHIIHGLHDPVPMDVANYIRENLGSRDLSTVDVIPTQGHTPQLTDPDTTLAALLRHL